ncbi:probable galactinol--sucrose galactosyltransferase 1 isoform X2 [Magnolia sinica]|uniref:probable galactinol--sucrose galactosyltransferase 1 isoform X2 n=1 Tax=Magnolia sinica TaxID=86752 RepID=UPI002659DF2C|nr:probable galactinol--sucrose galactosyltransferase 1 isoform X2 [Magnolia sinica]
MDLLYLGRSLALEAFDQLQLKQIVLSFRFKIWWMIPRYGKSSSDVPVKSQMLLLEAREDSSLNDKTIDSFDGNTFCILLMPVFNGDFQTSLQGDSTNKLQFCVEGDPTMRSKQVLEVVFINLGNNPFELFEGFYQDIRETKGDLQSP